MMIIYSIILDYNNARDTFLAFKSLQNQQLKEDVVHKIIVIDNGSSFRNREINKKNFSKENFKILEGNFDASGYDGNVLVVLDTNLGFTGGNNLAFEIALQNKVEYVLLFNNDAIAEETVIQKLIDNSKRKSITGGAIYDYDDRDKIQTLGTYAFGFKGYSVVPHEKIKQKKIKVASVSGACMLLPAKVLKEIGFFDDNFYLYSEENELSKRASKNGYLSYTISGAKVYHKGSATLGDESNLKFYYLVRNNLYFHKKHSSRIHYIAVIAYQFSVNLVKYISNKGKIKALFIALYDGVDDNLGKCTRELG